MRFPDVHLMPAQLCSPFKFKWHPCILAANIFNETAEGQDGAVLTEIYMEGT